MIYTKVPKTKRSADKRRVVSARSKQVFNQSLPRPVDQVDKYRYGRFRK